MASTTQVKQYLAYWFQLGKKVIVGKDQKTLLPSKVFSGDRYSPEFEACWRQIISQEDVYLDGTAQSIQQLLSPTWEISPCARCQMPVPIIDLGFSSPSCPCDDLDNWPNLELPSPRSGVNTHRHLSRLSQRLEETESEG